MQYLVATDSVYATAAACDHLEERLETDDTVTVVAVGSDDSRDAGDALNVANARLLGRASLETKQLAGESVDVNRLLEAADGADEVVVGTATDGPLGETAEAIVEQATVPVVVVPGDREA